MVPGGIYGHVAPAGGLPDEFLANFDAENRLRIPMRAASRSLNIANAVAIAIYEGWRQINFEGGR